MTAITHVVLVGWKSDAPSDIAEQANALVGEIAATIPGIRTAAAGTSVSPEGLEGPFTWGMSLVFDTVEARDAYLPHPTHHPLAALIGNHQHALSVFDIAGA